MKENIEKLRQNINLAARKINKNPSEITIIAATKTVSPQTINKLLDYSVTQYGENKAQEFLQKKDEINPDLKVNFIGHLQSNKIKAILPYVNLIQSVDTLDLAEKINIESQNINKIQKILLEVNIGREKNKFGFLEETLEENLYKFANLSNIKIFGLMTVAPHNIEKRILRNYFEKMNKLFVDMKAKTIDNVSMEILSMGMSNDYIEAIESGSNTIRIGSAIFGSRN